MPTTAQPNKKKRLLVAAAIFCLPVIALSVAIVGLWHSHKPNPAPTTNGSVFNTEMPSPNLQKTEKNKLQLYMQAEADSLKRSQDQQKDTYATPTATSVTPAGASTQGGILPASPALPLAPGRNAVASPFADNTDKQVSQRLEKIYAALGSTGSRGMDPGFSPAPPREISTAPSPDMAKLEKLMQVLQKADTAPSAELVQVRQVLDEIKAIQQPQRGVTSAVLPLDNAKTLPVAARPAPAVDSGAWTSASTGPNTFFGLDDDPLPIPLAGGGIQAVIHGDQTVQTGSTVKLRLVQPIYVGGVQIPANTFIYGTAGICGERVTIELTNAIYDGKVYPISMKVYDGSDGLTGLYVPGMITRDVLKQNMAQGVGGMSLGTLDPSLGAQAAAATIETAKNLFSRKIAIVKATLKAGHLAILKPGDGH
jgi:conjugative transposon TraM protein